ncbi:MAG: hypothetical protein KDE55_09800 [Novosphingobium sp.]|nr:hypothetical protein [Novosphingobium sp.]
MASRKTAAALSRLALFATLAPFGAAQAQEVNLNYDALSSLEEPIAFDLGQVTVELTGLVDVPLAFDLHGGLPGNDVEPGFVGNFQIGAQTQLANRWRVGAAYFGQYATDATPVFASSADDYTDNVAGFIGTSFGTVLGGNVGGQVREVTRRRRGVGNGVLAFDNFYGRLDNWGGAYVGRFGPMVLSAAVDENGDFEVGGVFQRPLGHKDYRFSLRFADGRFGSQDGSVLFDTKGAGAVAEFVYGSSLFDLGGGYERLESPVVDIDRWYISGGARTKTGPLTLSAEGHYGKAAGDSETAVALGAAFDFARGLSVNLGLNFEEAMVAAGPVTLVATDAVQGIASLRFSF